MRFGIHALQMSSIIPQNLPPAQALTHIAGFDHADHIHSLLEQGFDPIELGGDLALFLPHTFQEPAIERLNELKAETGVSFTVHLPLWSVETSTPLKPVRLGSVQALIDCIAATLPLQPDVYVLHATGALAAEFYHMRIPEIARTFVMRQFHSGAVESIKQILNETGLPSRKLAIETIEFPFELTLELAEDLDLSICFDTGHVLVGFSGPVDFFEALDLSLPRLAEVHLHDGPWQGTKQIIGYGQDHQALGKGDLDVGRFLDRLVEAHFDGPVIFELSIAEAHQSLEVIRQLRPNLFL